VVTNYLLQYKMSKPKEKHIERLLKGQKSGINIGSRSVPHHLRSHEKVQFEKAINQRFLTFKTSQRVNLENIWDKYCESKIWTVIVVKNTEDGLGEVLVDHKIVFSGDLKAAKQYAHSLVTKHHQL